MVEKRLTSLRQSCLASRACDIPVFMSSCAAVETIVLTLHARHGKLRLQVVDYRKERLDVQYKPLGQQDDIQQISPIDCTEHFANERGRRLFVSAQDVPDLQHLELHRLLPLFQLLGRHLLWLFRRAAAGDDGARRSGAALGGRHFERDGGRHGRVGGGAKVFARQADVPELSLADRGWLAYLGDHVAFRVPALVPAVPVHFHKLLQDRRLAADALDGEPGRVVEVAVCSLVCTCLGKGVNSQTLEPCS